MKQGNHETRLTILCLIVALAGSFKMSHAENLISDYVIQGEGVYPSTHVFTDPAPLRFSLNDTSMQGEWSFSLLTNNDTYMDAAFRPVESGICEFSSLEIPSSRWIWETKPIFDDSLNRDIFKLRVSFTSVDGSKDIKDIKLGLLPARPVISDVSYICKYNWETDYMEIGACFSFKVKSEGADEIIIHESEMHLYEPPAFYILSEGFKGMEEVEINYDEDWGVYLYVSARNHFGFVRSEVICSTDYITDPAVLSRIVELKEKDTGIDEIENEDPGNCRWDGTFLTFPAIASSVSVVDMGGREILSASNVESMDFSPLANGIYIVVYKLENKNNGVINRIKIMIK